jgi:hypothetical protein
LIADRIQMIQVFKGLIAGDPSFKHYKKIPELLRESVRKGVIESITAMIDASDDPVRLLALSDPPRPNRIADGNDPESRIRRSRKSMIESLIPTLVPNPAAVEFHVHRVANLASAHCALGVELFRLEHGHFPNTLADLIPAQQEKLPSDPFTNGPLLYRKTDDGVVVHSKRMKEQNARDRRRLSRRVSFRLLDPIHRHPTIENVQSSE